MQKQGSRARAARAWAALAIATAAFGAVTWIAWEGRLGVNAMVLLTIATVGYFLGRRDLEPAGRRTLDGIAKTLLTVIGMMALLRHPIEVEHGERLPIYEAIARYIGQVDARTFVYYACIGALVKFVGVVASAYAWHLLLLGQGLSFPFWSQVMTAFLIGRFLGTFLPSTIGLDGYTLYEAGLYSNQWPRAITAKALEKFIGLTGLFLGMVLTLPFGYQVIVNVTAQAGRPAAAPLLAGMILVIAGGFCAVVIVGLVWPVLLTGAMRALGRLLPRRLSAPMGQFTHAVGAYRGQVGLLLLALFCKFVTHFTTAVLYYFTALAIGVAGAEFWPIVFGSTIQILATVFSPTIAGEGAREAFQALLLSQHLGGVAQAVLSAALGFIAAEAFTMVGVVFLWVRKPEWRPTYVRVDGKQVDYHWIKDEEEGGLRGARVAVAGK